MSIPRKSLMCPSPFSSQMSRSGDEDRPMNPKGATRAFLMEYLGSNPGSTGPQIVAAGTDRHLRASSMYRHLANWPRIHRATGRYWLDEIEDPELAVAAKVERALA